jgi:uncharacterized phage-associated protein
MAQYDFEKFKNATIFFASRVKCLGITKLNKLLYFSDFEHYRLYGRPILGDKYTRMERGPVPSLSYAIFNSNFNDQTDDSLKDFIGIKNVIWGYPMKKIIAKKDFDPTVFSKSEIEIMTKVANDYAYCTASDLSKKSHSEKPWLETPELETIDYKLALSEPDSISKNYAEYREKEDEELEDILRG